MSALDALRSGQASIPVARLYPAIGGVVLLVALSFAVGAVAGSRSSAHAAADCILAHVPGTQTERGAIEVREACREKSPWIDPAEALPDVEK